jgi:PST family polysaccharide transporter
LSEAGKNSYGQIVKSSAVIGGSSMIKIGLGIIRNKALALLLGPAGIGLMGVYESLANLTQTVGGFGINTSGVRQIAEAAGTNDAQRIARTVTTLRRVAVILGALGALLLVIFCKPVSRLTFGDDQHAGTVALLALAVFFAEVSAGQIALVQGMRRIRDLALSNLLGAVYGTVFGIGLVYLFWRAGNAQAAVVPVLVCVSGMSIVTSWWYSRKIKVERVRMRFSDISGEVAELLKLGAVFMVTTLLAFGAAYLIRIIVLRGLGDASAGYYQAAWGLGGMYVGIILQSMGADFYPRLTGIAKDNAACNRLVNEQAEVSLLLAGPGVMATLTLAPLVIQIFYSKHFGPAVEVLRWVSLGMLLRVISWPLGYVLLAKGARKPFFWTELLGAIFQVGLVWLLLPRYQLVGAGIAFFGSYLLYLTLIYAVVRSISGFRWSRASLRIGLVYGVLVSLVFAAWYVFPQYDHLGVEIGGTLVSIAAGIYSMKRICGLVPLERLPRVAQRVLRLLRLAPALAVTAGN